MAKLEYLQDPFNSNGRRVGMWTQFTGGSARLDYGVGGVSSIFPASSTSASDGDITSVVTTWDLTGSYCYLEVVSVLGGTHTDTNLRLMNVSVANMLQFEVEAGVLYAQSVVASVSTNVFSATYNAVTHRWWRIRESAGTIFWDVSPDGITWNNFTSLATPITITSITINISGDAFGADTNAGSFTWRNFNIRGQTHPLNNSGLRPHPFSPGLAR